MQLFGSVFFLNIIFSYLLALDLLDKYNVLCYFSTQDFTSWINDTFTCSLSQVLSLFKVEISLFENVSFRMKIYTDIFQMCSRLHCHQTLEWDYLQYVISQNIPSFEVNKKVPFIIIIHTFIDILRLLNATCNQIFSVWKSVLGVAPFQGGSYIQKHFILNSANTV